MKEKEEKEKGKSLLHASCIETPRYDAAALRLANNRQNQNKDLT
jgi:hypothetical protein